MTFHSSHTLQSDEPGSKTGSHTAVPQVIRPMRIAIVTGYVPIDMMGGAEYQAMLLSKALVQRGHEVAFIATRASIDDESSVEGLTVFRIAGQEPITTRGLQAKILDVMARFSPDICYVRIFPDLAAVAGACKTSGVPFVSTSSAGFETSPFQFSCSPREVMRQFRSFQAIRSAEVHCCNTLSLQDKVHRWLPATTIKTIYNGQQVPTLERKNPKSSGQVVWVNNVKRWKRPEVIIELARRLPQYSFVMIGRMAGGRFGRKIGRLFQQAPDNCQYLGPLPVEEANQHIADSDLLLYTSLPLEGFGNSFIQAWFRYVPTVTLSVDVDGIIERERLGRRCQTIDELVQTVDELMEDESTRFQMGQRARDFALRNLSQETMVSNYEALFADVLQCQNESQVAST